MLNPQTDSITKPIEKEDDAFDSNFILRYLKARISLGVVKYLNIDDAWSDPENSCGLLFV
jgi:hypothetical protein